MMECKTKSINDLREVLDFWLGSTRAMIADLDYLGEKHNSHVDILAVANFLRRVASETELALSVNLDWIERKEIKS